MAAQSTPSYDILTVHANEDGFAPRINARLLPRYIGKNVRLFCEPLSRSNHKIIVKTTDSKEIEILTDKVVEFESKYLEIKAVACSATSLKMIDFAQAGDDCDLEELDDVIEMTHEERFRKAFRTLPPISD